MSDPRETIDGRGALLVPGPAAQDLTPTQRECGHTELFFMWGSPDARCTWCGLLLEGEALR